MVHSIKYIEYEFQATAFLYMLIASNQIDTESPHTQFLNKC